MAKKEEIEALRLDVSYSLTAENNEGYFYCDECGALIVWPEGECKRTDGPVETMEHALNCPFTARREELGLEDPLDREIKCVRLAMLDLADQIETETRSVAENETNLRGIQKRLRSLEEAKHSTRKP